MQITYKRIYVKLLALDPHLPFSQPIAQKLSVNSMLKKQVNYKKTQWLEFVQQMKALIDTERNEIIRSLSGKDRYRLSARFRYLGVSIEEWNKAHSD